MKVGEKIYKGFGRALTRVHRAVAPLVGAVKSALAYFVERVEFEYEVYRTILSLYPATLKAVFRGDRTTATEIRRSVWRACKLYAALHSPAPTISSPPAQYLTGCMDNTEFREQLGEQLKKELQELQELGRGGENQ